MIKDKLGFWLIVPTIDALTLNLEGLDLIYFQGHKSGSIHDHASIMQKWNLDAQISDLALKRMFVNMHFIFIL